MTVDVAGPNVALGFRAEPCDSLNAFNPREGYRVVFNDTQERIERPDYPPMPGRDTQLQMP